MYVWGGGVALEEEGWGLLVRVQGNEPFFITRPILLELMIEIETANLQQGKEIDEPRFITKKDVIQLNQVIYC